MRKPGSHKENPWHSHFATVSIHYFIVECLIIESLCYSTKKGLSEASDDLPLTTTQSEGKKTNTPSLAPFKALYSMKRDIGD
jgi:hypothetical protein